jgi:hypothetical protein
VSAPPPYPRVAHLVGGRGSRDDLILDAASVSDLLGSDVVVEEKIDGANVAIWAAREGQPEVGLRGGSDAMDRAGQRGPLKAWVAQHEQAVRAILDRGWAVYAEWLLLTHTVAYDRLPSYLVVLDLWREGEGFASVEERDAIAAAAGLCVPPELWRGVPGSLNRIEALLGTSVWGLGRAEGLVVRRAGSGEPRLAKLVRAGFDRIADEAWTGGRPRNRLVEGQVSWR